MPATHAQNAVHHQNAIPPRYTLGFIESVYGVRRGERVLQVGVGSGIKCGVNVWRAVRDVHDVQDAWAHRLVMYWCHDGGLRIASHLVPPALQRLPHERPLQGLLHIVIPACVLPAPCISYMWLPDSVCNITDTALYGGHS